jgi:hypothetical protein
MLDHRSANPRMTTATRRRLVALAVTRTSRYGLRAIAAPGLVAAAPGESADPRPSI